VIEQHPTLRYKEIFYDPFVMVAFYDIVKDDAGNECFDDFFVTDLQGGILDLQEETYEHLKRLI
jgi:hypothetical protein